jgi:hypothetical protein
LIFYSTVTFEKHHHSIRAVKALGLKVPLMLLGRADEVISAVPMPGSG